MEKGLLFGGSRRKRSIAAGIDNIETSCKMSHLSDEQKDKNTSNTRSALASSFLALVSVGISDQVD